MAPGLPCNSRMKNVNHINQVKMRKINVKRLFNIFTGLNSLFSSFISLYSNSVQIPYFQTIESILKP